MFVCDPWLVSLNYLNFSTFHFQHELSNVALRLCLAVKLRFLGAGKSCNCADSLL